MSDLCWGRTIWFLGGGGGGGLDYYFQLCFFFWKISTQFFLLAPTLKQTFFLSLEKNKTFFCDISYVIKYVDKCHALTFIKVSTPPFGNTRIIFEYTAHVPASNLVIFSLVKKMGGCSIIPYLVFDITPSISGIPVVTLGTTTSCTTFRCINGRARG